MMGTRGVPAAYGGFETAVEEIGRRLVERGHDVTVYCRISHHPVQKSHLGMRLVHLPSLRMKVAETLSNTALAALHVMLHRKPDVAFIFNAANSPFLPVLRLRRIPTALHVDGLEWKRGKWGESGRRYYRWAEAVAVRWADALIADADGISAYFRREFDVPTELLAYGAPILRNVPSARLAPLGLEPGGFHLLVARFEPENHVDLIVEGYRRSGCTLPLVVVGSAPYAAAYTARVEGLAAPDPRIRMLGGVWDQELLDQLYAHALSYLHGHSVGGTNPSLLRAMGAATAVIAWDVNFNRDVAGPDGLYFTSAESLSYLLDEAEDNRQDMIDIGLALQERAEFRYTWESVVDGYEALARRLTEGYSTHGANHPRALESAWPVSAPAPAGILASMKTRRRAT
ncbi:DUF1972 domain-containing protein [Cryobacterium roopkundense]|uniref:Glycosyltransferase involved in cell wall biosynthesis n=1 Tax=Cryobacterium roopkundense TaxID=1001240 RepID=A0A7W8ZYZ5_9MICO|nr:glycosyltransferase involved in cell wall biosynthesis [Cryobacterium roopkundense]